MAVQFPRIEECKPARNVVLLKAHIVKESKGGIIIPDQAQKIEQVFTVMKIGPLVTDKNCKEGTDVLLGPTGNTKIECTIGGEKHWLVPENAIVMYYEPTKNSS